MEVSTLQMDPRIAFIHFKDYRKKVRENRAKRELEAKAMVTEGNKKRVSAYKLMNQMEKEDVIMMESYRAMAKGHRIINVGKAIAGAGLDKTLRLPVLALARANWKDCWLRLEHGHLTFSSDFYLEWGWRTGLPRALKKVNLFSSTILGAEITDAAWRKTNNFPSVDRAKAIVPTIPAYLRPAGDLENYHILFEAKWEKAAPPDPLLLKHVAGQMYVVLAQWDLTEIEKSVLEGRFT